MNAPSSSLPVPPPLLRDFGARLALILGSGLSRLAEHLESVTRLPYAEIPGLPVSKVPGHEGAFLLGEWGGEKVILASGRVHLYEGWSAGEVSAGVRLLAASGVTTLLLTNAAGSLNPTFFPGEWMMLSDHLNLQGTSPLEGSAHFLDLSSAYDAELRSAFRRAARRENIPLREGVYAAVRGPQYETPAEVRAWRVLGADAVGMSTVPEVIQARALGLRVAGFSCLTNWGAGISNTPLSHDEVTTTGQAAAEAMIRLLRRVNLAELTSQPQPG